MFTPLVEERCVRGEAAGGSLRGLQRSEDAGMSSEKGSENLPRRKPKGS